MISALARNEPGARREAFASSSLVSPLAIETWRDACEVDEQGEPERNVHGADLTRAKTEGLCRTS